MSALESTEPLASYGGPSGFADCAEAARFLMNAFAGLATVFALVRIVECPACKRPPDAVNHVEGAVFHGYGMGWRRCHECNGTRKVIP